MATIARKALRAGLKDMLKEARGMAGCSRTGEECDLIRAEHEAHETLFQAVLTDWWKRTPAPDRAEFFKREGVRAALLDLGRVERDWEEVAYPA